MSKYLLEIGTEELPANFSHSVLNQFKSQIEFEFDKKLIKFEQIYCTSTPRRIVLLLDGLVDQGEDEMIIRKGPKASLAISFFFFTFSTLINGPKHISFYTLAKSLFNR